MNEKELPNYELSKRQISYLWVLVALLMFALVIMPSSHAMTITMSNPGAMSERDVIAYFPNGTMQGYYNSTSVITLDANESYIFMMKPLQSNPLTDPSTWLSDVAVPFVQSNVIGLVLLVFLGVMWVRK